MTADASKVRDETFQLILVAVANNYPEANMYWEGVVPSSGPTPNDIWVRTSLVHVTGRQSSLAGEDGVRRWNRTGFVQSQCFAPLARGSVQAATRLATVIRDALQGKQTESCVWFRNPRIIEIGEEKDWFNVNAIIDFDYDELR